MKVQLNKVDLTTISIHTVDEEPNRKLGLIHFDDGIKKFVGMAGDSTTLVTVAIGDSVMELVPLVVWTEVGQMEVDK